MKDFKKSVLRTAILAGLMGMANSPMAQTVVNGQNVDILTSQQGDPAVLFETDNSANVRDGKDLVGTAGSAVQATSGSQGALLFEGTSGAVGDIGSVDATLKSVTIDVNGIGRR